MSGGAWNDRKKFNRDGVLARVPFRSCGNKGFANTTVQHLERATAVNKSGLYTEFGDKGGSLSFESRIVKSKLVARKS